MLNINDLLIKVKAKQSKSPNDKGLLIREIFLLWYALLEGVECENFSEAELTQMLNKCAERFKRSFYNDADCNFMVGWVVTTAFWILSESFVEEDGQKMLASAYKHNPTNTLFKWANRNELRLSIKEIDSLIAELQNKFSNYYNYGPYIKDYFLGIMPSSLS